jgi:hypothetical protein
VKLTSIAQLCLRDRFHCSFIQVFPPVFATQTHLLRPARLNGFFYDPELGFGAFCF